MELLARWTRARTLPGSACPGAYAGSRTAGVAPPKKRRSVASESIPARPASHRSISIRSGFHHSSQRTSHLNGISVCCLLMGLQHIATRLLPPFTDSRRLLPKCRRIPDSSPHAALRSTRNRPRTAMQDVWPMTRSGNQVRGLDLEYASLARCWTRQPAFLLVRVGGGPGRT